MEVCRLSSLKPSLYCQLCMTMYTYMSAFDIACKQGLFDERILLSLVLSVSLHVIRACEKQGYVYVTPVFHCT